MGTKKYRLTGNHINIGSRILYQIEALKDFGDVKAGDLGGYIESEENLSQYDNAWVYNDAQVFGNARVYGNAYVYGNAHVFGNAQVYGDAYVFDNARVYNDAQVFGNARVYGNARVFGDAQIKSARDYIVFKNWWSSGRYFTWTRSNNMWKVGCFYGTGEELIKKAYNDSEISGREYERIVRYVESILADEKRKENEPIGIK